MSNIIERALNNATIEISKKYGVYFLPSQFTEIARIYTEKNTDFKSFAFQFDSKLILALVKPDGSFSLSEHILAS
ncbi:MAG: hypothetical protein HFJ45_04695 [Clostridia bacterium]|nr:hypothetical protein [Clostridia bacterium]